jgi:stage V sporulation protein S
MEVVKVSAHSRSTAVAGAIAGIIRERGHAEVQAIGASAVNQAVKAAAIARTYLAMDGIEIACLPEFVEVEIEGQERTAVRLVIVTREGPPPSPAPQES